LIWLVILLIRLLILLVGHLLVRVINVGGAISLVQVPEAAVILGVHKGQLLEFSKPEYHEAHEDEGK
jgi:hypothetical protein